MSRRMRSVVRALRSLFVLSLAGCIEPSEIEDPEALIAAASLRDGGLGPVAGASVTSGTGGAGGRSGAGGGGAGGRSGAGGASGGAGAGAGGRSGAGGASGAGAGGRSGAGGAGSGGMSGAACGDVVATLFTPTCAVAGCHNPTGASQLKLMAMNTADSLIGTEASMTCEGELYIDPDAPEQSLIYTKLGADPPCGLRMPLGSMVTDAQRACVLEWIMDAVAGQ